MQFASGATSISKYPSMHYDSIRNIAKLCDKGDVYSNIFNQIDKDKNGTLDKEEFDDATRALNLCLTEKEVSHIYDSIAKDNVLTLHSFKKFIQKSMRIHKQFMKFRHEFTSGIINNLFIEEPTYKFIFNNIKLTQLQQINITLPLLSDKSNKQCFIGYIRMTSIHNKPLQTINDHDIVENERHNILIKLLPYSQIVSINDINCHGIGYRQIINIINQTVLPHTILFRKTVGIAMDNNDENDYCLSDEDDDADNDEYDILSIADSEKYVVHDKSPKPVLNKKQQHCKYCPDETQHSLLFAIHSTFEDESYNNLSFCIITYIMILIILSTITYIIETLPVIQSMKVVMDIIHYIEWIVSISFSIEYLVRIIACNHRFKYFVDIMNMIDFLSVIPFWIELMSGTTTTNILRVIRVIRLARIIRLMKNDHFTEYLHVFIATIKRSSESFGLLSTLILLQVILFGSLFYVIEAGENELFSSIPMGAFYTVVTITTVGYGDMLPVTVLGRVVAIFCMFSGLLIVALPVIIIGGNFEKEYREYIAKKKKKIIVQKAKKIENTDKISRRDQGFCEVYQFLRNINHKFETDIFQPQDAHIMCRQGINSEQRLLELLYNERGYAFYPSEIKKSKIFILHELYGAHIRRIKCKKH